MRRKSIIVTALAAVATTLCVAAPAFAGPPNILPREKWDPNGECKAKKAPEKGQCLCAVINHTHRPDSNYTAEQVPALIRGIFNFHTTGTNNWDDIGYQFIVDKFGNIYEARAGGIDQPLVGAHTYGYNRVSVGIGLLGDFVDQAPTPEMMKALAKLIAWKLKVHGQPVSGTVDVLNGATKQIRTVHRVSGASEIFATESPGRAFVAVLPVLRKMVEEEYAELVREDAGAGATATSSGAAAGNAGLNSNNNPN
jgi:hypothetical protein